MFWPFSKRLPRKSIQELSDPQDPLLRVAGAQGQRNSGKHQAWWTQDPLDWELLSSSGKPWRGQFLELQFLCVCDGTAVNCQDALTVHGGVHAKGSQETLSGQKRSRLCIFKKGC